MVLTPAADVPLEALPSSNAFEEGDDSADQEAGPSVAGASKAAAKPADLRVVVGAHPQACGSVVGQRFGTRLAWPLWGPSQTTLRHSHCKDRPGRNGSGSVLTWIHRVIENDPHAGNVLAVRALS